MLVAQVSAGAQGAQRSSGQDWYWMDQQVHKVADKVLKVAPRVRVGHQRCQSGSTGGSFTGANKEQPSAHIVELLGGAGGAQGHLGHPKVMRVMQGATRGCR